MLWNYVRFWPLAVFLFLLSLFSNVFPVAAKEITSPHTSAASQPTIIKYTKNLTIQHLNARPDDDQIELSNGKRIRLGDVRKFTKTAHKARTTPPGSLTPQAFKLKPSPTGGFTVRSKADLDNVLKRPDTDTVVLPSGKRTTVAMLKLLQPQVDEQRRLRPPSATKTLQRPNLSGNAEKITAQTDWYSVLKKPDNTVLENNKGKRITVGELKQTMSAGTLSRTPSTKTVR